jgi:hypothetical protein
VKIEKRLRALEARLSSEPVVLGFADGSTKEICGPRHFLLDLFCATRSGADLSPVQAEQLDLIRQSVSAREPGGGHMVELVRLFADRPIENHEVDNDEESEWS